MYRSISYAVVINKESVEMLVYLEIGIWRDLDENKQYSTPAQYGAGTERANITYQYKWCKHSLSFHLKSPNFISKD